MGNRDELLDFVADLLTVALAWCLVPIVWLLDRFRR